MTSAIKIKKGIENADDQGLISALYIG